MEELEDHLGIRVSDTQLTLELMRMLHHFAQQHHVDTCLGECVGMVALKQTLAQLPHDHSNARLLAEGMTLPCVSQPHDASLPFSRQAPLHCHGTLQQSCLFGF